MIAAPVPGFYLVSSDDELRVYDHAKRAVVGEVLKVEGGVTALGTDEASSLIAVGTSSGELLLLKLDIGGSVPRLDVLSRTSTYDLESRTDVLAVMLRDEGRQLVTDRKRVVEGKSVSVRVDLGGRRIIKNKHIKKLQTQETI